MSQVAAAQHSKRSAARALLQASLKLWGVRPSLKQRAGGQPCKPGSPAGATGRPSTPWMICQTSAAASRLQQASPVETPRPQGSL